jgi:hypothetical protein
MTLLSSNSRHVLDRRRRLREDRGLFVWQEAAGIAGRHRQSVLEMADARQDDSC